MNKTDLLYPTTINFTSAEFAILSEMVLKAGKSIKFRAPGVSMQPLIRDGDQLVVIPAELGKIRVGDILLFTDKGGKALVHRVIKRQESDGEICFIMQGDHVTYPDGCIAPSRILGRITLIEREGKIINTKGIIMRTMGRIVVWYSGEKPHGNKFVQSAYHFLRRLPVLNKYLS